MSSGYEHDVETLIGAMVASTAVAIVTRTPDLAISAAVGFLFGGMLASPDVDLPQSKPSRRWTVLSGIWWPFTLAGHRSWISHTPVVSSVFRLGYIALLVLAGGSMVPALSTAMQGITWPYAAMFFIAALCAGELHLYSDWRSSARVEMPRRPARRAFNRTSWQTPRRRRRP